MALGMSTGGKIAVVLLVLILLGAGYVFLSGKTPYGSGGPSGFIPQLTPKPVLSIGNVNYARQGNIIQGYTVPVTFVVSNSGNGDATDVKATVTLTDSNGNVRGNQDTSLGSISPGGETSGTVTFNVGRIETLQGVTFQAKIHVSSDQGAYADY